MTSNSHSLATKQIASLIRWVRNVRVILDHDLARLYGVETKMLNQAVKKNRARFPEEFIFQLTKNEWTNLKSQIVTSSSRHRRRRTPPCFFTEQGVAMLYSELKDPRMAEVNIAIMRTFVQLRQPRDANKHSSKTLNLWTKNSMVSSTPLIATFSKLPADTKSSNASWESTLKKLGKR